jgi:Zn-finger nucleic acid-binding protein
MSKAYCSICDVAFTVSGRGNFRYCPTCRGKIERGELDAKRNARWITDAERTRQRANYFRTLKRRKERYAYVDARRASGELVCYWCKKIIPVEKAKKHSKQKFCNRNHSGKDQSEGRKLTDYYYHLGKKGNEKLRHIEYMTGIRPGTEKRRAHIARLTEERRNGKPWGKTGPKKQR